MAGTVDAGSIIYEVDMDTAKLLAARREVDAALNGMGGNMGRLEANINRTERASDSASRSMSKLTGVASGLLAALSVQQVGAYADAWTDLNNKVANSVKQGEQQTDVMQRIFDISQDTQASLNGTATLYARLERGTRLYNTSAADLVKLTTIINQGFAVSGATAQEAENAIIQLSQGLAAGALRGEEYNSVAEQGSRLTIALADSLGVSIGRLRAMAAEGKLTTEVVVNGLLSQGEAIGKEFANTTVTISKGLQVAGNNITKFFGENSTVKSFAAGFRDSVITMSENLEALSGALILVATTMGTRYAAAITMATAAKVKSTMASVQQANADRQLAKDELGAASAVQRRAVVEKEAAIAERTRAERTLATLRATNASTVAEVAHADAELASIRVNLQQIQAEKALEIQRARSQITEQGRIATATRMAQLRQAETVLIQQAARAEAVAQNARATAYTAASAQIATANSQVITTTAAVTAANGAMATSQERVAATSITAMSALRRVNSFLMPLGGVAGILMIAAAGWYLYAQNQAQAREESIAFADTLPDVIKKLKDMNLAQAQGVSADTVTSIKNQKEALEDLQSEISGLESEYKKYIDAAKAYGAEQDENNGLVIQAARVANELMKKRRDLDVTTAKLNQTQDAYRLINIQVNQGFVDQMKAARDNALAVAEAEKQASFLGGTQAFLAEKLGQSTQALKEFNSESLKINWGGKEGEKLIKQAERRLALSKLEGEAKARQQAAYDAEDAKVTDPLAIKQLQDKYAATEKNTQARKDQKKEDNAATSAASKLANQQEAVTQKLASLKQQSELAATSTQELSREQAILRAEQSLGKAATTEQVKQAHDYAAAIWDTAAAIKARNAIPELKENADYTAQKSQLEMLKSAKDANGKLLISQEQYNAASEQLEQEHQTKLAQIRAGQAVSPQQEAAGIVDPVQALANENTRKLALIQQFEKDKTISEQQGLALRNSLNTQFEQQRIAAQWEIWRNQSTGNEALAASFDALAGNASNALTGMITGSMSANEAMRSLGSTVLNSLVNTFVQMGVEWVKSAVMGAAAQNAAVATTTATQIGGIAATTAASTTAAGATLAAWLPAALVASIGSFGAAAVVGGAALLAGFGLISALSGKRKNGGPVSAGSMYQVGEGGMPEIYQASNGSQYMIPGDNGKVISNKDINGGGGITVINNIENYSSGAMVDTQASSDGNGNVTIQTIVTDIANGGQIGQAISNYHNAPRRARG